MNRSRLRLAALLSGAAVTASVLTLMAVRARAAGIPEADLLTYSGYLEDGDGPLKGTHSIAVQFWASEDAADDLCTGKLSSVELVSGRFQVPLPPSCAEAVKAGPDIWASVDVDGATLGRTKLGAVPFAIEAGHATSADTATSAATAAAAEGALDDRITAIEDAGPGKSAFYAFTSAATPLPNQVYKAIPFDSVKYDLGGEFANGVFKAKTAGLYFFSCNAHLDIPAPGTTAYFESILFVSGVNWGASSGQGDLWNATRNVEQLVKLAKGDTVNCTTFQTSGSSRGVTGTFVGFRVSL